MGEIERKTIHIPEITRVEGHAAVHVDIADGRVSNVILDVFEGTRFFEQLVVGHKYEEIPHITSRVCAICSTGHVLAAIFALEHILEMVPDDLTRDLREIMHLGMIIESHATHIYALALPDYVGCDDLLSLANDHPEEFSAWTKLRNFGAHVQTVLGGRPFHPVNMHVGGFSSLPKPEDLLMLQQEADKCMPVGLRTAELLLGFKPPVARITDASYLALVPEGSAYGYFGKTIRSSTGWEDEVSNYKHYLNESVAPYSHAKRSSFNGKPLMVGSMARLRLYHDRLNSAAREKYDASPLAKGDSNGLWNNLAQSIEVIEAIQRLQQQLPALAERIKQQSGYQLKRRHAQAGEAVGAVECPRGTLYHAYSIDKSGTILSADMITPSAQNSARIEQDIREVVDQASMADPSVLQAHLETLVRAYDPCNTCATHMVSVNFIQA